MEYSFLLTAPLSSRLTGAKESPTIGAAKKTVWKPIFWERAYGMTEVVYILFLSFARNPAKVGEVDRGEVKI